MQNNHAAKQNPPVSRAKKTASILSVAAFLLLLVFLTVFVGGPLIRSLSDPSVFREWVDARGAWGRVLFVGMIILQVVVAFIPAEPLEIAAGYAFGAFWGTLLVWIGLVVGSMIVFLFVRKIGVKAVEVFFPREKINSLKFLKDEKTLNVTAFFLFLIPGTPKDLLTYFAGLTKIKLLPWVVLTSIARIPSIITSTISGDALGTQRYVFAIIVFTATALVSGAGMLLYRALQKKRALRDAAEALAQQPLTEYTDLKKDEPEETH